MRLRRARPKLVWEISPADGFSTLVILSALKANNNGARLHSFDRHAEVASHLSAERYPSLHPLWTFHQGDVYMQATALMRHGRARQQRSQNRSAVTTRGPSWPLQTLAARPDYLYLDSWHSQQMGAFYVDNLLPAVQQAHTYVSLHDVYNPLFWTDDAPNRSLVTYPSDIPNLEGSMVLDWLVYPHLADACRLFTAAPSKRGNRKHHVEILRLRAAAGLGPEELLDPYRGACPEPTIFFELGCSAAAAAHDGTGSALRRAGADVSTKSAHHAARTTAPHAAAPTTTRSTPAPG